jgi:hypothetical protein
MKTRLLAAALSAAFSLAFAGGPPQAMAQQPSAAAKPSERGVVLIPGVMTGPGAIGPIGRRRFCDARSAGLTQMKTGWLARLLKPNDAQTKALDELAAASAKAIDMFAGACPKRVPRLQTSAEQFEMMERRIDNAAQAVKTVRPAFAAFYALLDDRQKAKLDELGPHRSGWLW